MRKQIFGNACAGSSRIKPMHYGWGRSVAPRIFATKLCYNAIPSRQKRLRHQFWKASESQYIVHLTTDRKARWRLLRICAILSGTRAPERSLRTGEEEEETAASETLRVVRIWRILRSQITELCDPWHRRCMAASLFPYLVEPKCSPRAYPRTAHIVCVCVCVHSVCVFTLSNADMCMQMSEYAKTFVMQVGHPRDSQD
jgi:hypothetical protein